MLFSDSPYFLRFWILNNNLMSRPQWITDNTGRITGYKTQGGADTVFPFSNVADGTFTGVLNTPVTVHTGFKPDRICIAPVAYINRNSGIYYYPYIGIASNVVAYHGKIQVTNDGFIYTALDSSEAVLHYYTACKI